MIDLTNFRPTFSDEFGNFSPFTGASGTWKTEYMWGGDRTLSNNGERQFYVDPGYQNLGLNPFSVGDGALTITAKPAPADIKPLINNLDYTSGVITSEQSFSMQYGYFEMRAQLPAGKGLWPAFWLQPIDGSWPPELDIMEVLGHEPTKLFTSTHSNDPGLPGATKATDVADTSTGFHTYGVDWGPNTITWYFDGQPVYEVPTPADMHQPMYMIANLAVGGHWPGNPDGTTSFPAEMKIDYIRAYQRPADHSPQSIPSTWAPIDPASFSMLDATGAVSTWDLKRTMGANEVKLKLNGDWSRFAVGNELDNYIEGSTAQYNELDGGKGNDVLKGDHGTDVFVIRNGAGNDVILDLSNTSGNTDKVRLDGFHFTHFEDVKPWLSQVGADVMLRLDEDQALLLKNTTIDELEPEQFAFNNPVPLTNVPSSGSSAPSPTPLPEPTPAPSPEPTPAPLPEPTAGVTRYGTPAEDNLTGTAHSDTLLSKEGNDYLTGLEGDDILEGGAGADVLIGGNGRDTFRFSAATDAIVGPDRDIIADWESGSDLIDLRGIDANTKRPGNQAFNWIDTKELSGKAGQLHCYFDGENTIIEGTVDQNRSVDFQIELSGWVDLDRSDFLL